MAVSRGSTRRQLLPRWRSSFLTAAVGELKPARESAAVPIDLTKAAERSFLEARAAFRDRAGPGRATSLLLAALGADRGFSDEDVQEAALVLGSQARSELQRAVAGRRVDVADRVPHSEVCSDGRRVARLRQILSNEPRNALRWMDLALEFIIRGDTRRAGRACETATSLARSNRFILRSAARYWQHAGELDRARHLIDSAETTSTDPWLIAASVALADWGESSSPYTRAARRVLEASDVHPWHLSELAGAVATMEWRLGSDRQARRHMRQALEDPTENALAQAEWAQERGLFQDYDLTQTDAPLRFEATARHFAYEFQWKEAMEDADAWLSDQPFSTEAALFGSWTASQTEDYARALQFCERGRAANPKNVWLANNSAYALAKDGNPHAAQRWLAEAMSLEPDARQRAYLTATQGLVHFRQGQAAVGRQNYEEAISRLLAQKRRDEATMAKVILAEEEIRAGTEMAVAALSRAEKAIKETTARFVLARWNRLRDSVAVDRLKNSGLGR